MISPPVPLKDARTGASEPDEPLPSRVMRPRRGIGSLGITELWAYRDLLWFLNDDGVCLFLISFEVVDHSEGDGVRGEYSNEWPGVVRPLEWALEDDVTANEALVT